MLKQIGGHFKTKIFIFFHFSYCGKGENVAIKDL